MAKNVRFRIEVNLARKGAEEPVWHYLMEDEYSSCEYDDEAEARSVMMAEGRGSDIRLIGFTSSDIGQVIKTGG